MTKSELFQKFGIHYLLVGSVIAYRFSFCVVFTLFFFVLCLVVDMSLSLDCSFCVLLDKNRMGHKKTNTNKEQHHIKKTNKNIEQQHRPLQKLGELGWFRKVSSSCFLYSTRHVVHPQRHIPVYRIQWFPFKRFYLGGYTL